MYRGTRVRCIHYPCVRDVYSSGFLFFFFFILPALARNRLRDNNTTDAETGFRSKFQFIYRSVASRRPIHEPVKCSHIFVYSLPLPSLSSPLPGNTASAFFVRPSNVSCSLEILKNSKFSTPPKTKTINNGNRNNKRERNF